MRCPDSCSNTLPGLIASLPEDKPETGSGGDRGGGVVKEQEKRRDDEDIQLLKDQKRVYEKKEK